MDPAIVGGLLGLLGGIFSGGISAWAIFRVRYKEKLDLEFDEIRRKKVEIIYKLIGSRYVLTKDYPRNAYEVKDFNTALSQFPIYFSDDRDVVATYEKYIDDLSADKLTDLLVSAVKSINLDVKVNTLKTVPSAKPMMQTPHSMATTDRNSG